MSTASEPLAVSELSAAERQVWDRLAAEGPRRLSWLLGRAALRPLMEGTDTAGLAFPHRRLSLSHSGPLAVAVSVDDHDLPRGVGVDIETRQHADARTARFFLHDHELTRNPPDVLRLWTVKEALFKATPDNSRGGLLDYRVADPSEDDGTATDVAGRGFRYASGLLGPYRLSVAVCTEDARAAV